MDRELPKYEKLSQKDFENLLVEIVASIDNSSWLEASSRLLKITNDLTMESSECWYDESTYSIRKGMWERLREFDYVAF